MQIPRRQRVLLTLYSLAVLWMTGCAEMELPSWVPFQGPASDTLAGVVPPWQRMAEYRKLAEAEGKVPASEKVRISEQLASTIATEQDPLIRSEIIRTLGVYPSPAADAVLKAAMSDADAHVRLAASEAWGKRGGEQAIALLAEAVHGDVDSDVRLAAAKALGDTGDKGAVKPLGDALNSDDPAMQYAAVLSLKKVTGESYGDVGSWQQYVRGETPPTPTLAERFQQMF